MRTEETGHAVVVGAGVAGMLTAHVLGQRFSRVTVVERDACPDGPPAFRAGVPQSRHVHVLWSRGLTALEHLLPGVVADLEAAGGTVIEAPAHMRWLSAADWFSGVRGSHYLSISRERLEATLRGRILARPTITLTDRHEVTGLVAGRSAGRVGGVRLRERGKGGQESTARAGLVVVAAGRGSRSGQWLSELGYRAPVTERIDAHLGYASRYYRRPPAGAHRWKAVYVQGNPDVPRGGVLVPVDGERWLVTLIGQGDQQPPVEADAWLAFAASLRSPELAQALTGTEPLSDPVAFRATANEWTHFERAERWPSGLLVVGDALCRFNPVYGHGMTVAALQAQTIARRISSQEPEGAAARAAELQKAVAKCLRAAWAIATGEDSRYPSTDGPAPNRLDRMQQRYLARVLAAANTDPVVSEAFFAVLSLNRRPETLLTPRIMARVSRRR
ncbi:FAD-dependent oxidoreductase [Streptomyces sp. NPDC059740]|uniref:FAD-dependent oxidoreductase n=1 Tax=Streptomyces sp. NPDC059740 TaxID=3346926 RepID=UPI003665F737